MMSTPHTEGLRRDRSQWRPRQRRNRATLDPTTIEHYGVVAPLHRAATATPTLSQIVGVEADPTLQVVRVGVYNGVVRIRLNGTEGVFIRYFTGDDARCVITDLLVWSERQLDALQRTPGGLDEQAAVCDQDVTRC